MKKIIFAVIAMREVRFFVEIARQIQSHAPDIDTAFISFFQPGNSIIRKNGFKCFDIYSKLSDPGKISSALISSIEAEYGIENLHKLLIHEKLTHGIFNDQLLIPKFVAYLHCMDGILQEIMHDRGHNELTIMQELGGFIAPLALYFTARKQGIRHVFFEPAFFRGRLYFVEDSLRACRPEPGKTTESAQEQVRAYLGEAKSRRDAIIPDKDRHHFQGMGLRKVFNLLNLVKLYKKFKYKYAQGHRQEYEYIWNHALRSLRMLVSRKLNARVYTQFDGENREKSYIYFPLHVQLDYALTVRNPEYLDQMAFLRYLSDVLPGDLLLYVKEHPASVGGFGYLAFRELVRKHKNIRVIHPSTNSYDIIDNARLVITINSKVGAEALMLGKKVIVLGDAFCSGSKIVRDIGNPKELDQAIREVLKADTSPVKEEIEQFFTRLWEITYPGELYMMESENIQVFLDSLLKFMAISAKTTPSISQKTPDIRSEAT